MALAGKFNLNIDIAVADIILNINHLIRLLILLKH